MKSSALNVNHAGITFQQQDVALNQSQDFNESFKLIERKPDKTLAPLSRSNENLHLQQNDSSANYRGSSAAMHNDEVNVLATHSSLSRTDDSI
jgi:hypothetical protein